ncbi:Glutathione S-transferase 2 [Friedmanniomyces endolithicus]|uniref:Glutathione S-transferase 2 n=1 Tax=Friedmanniomyces endolithicus TaxID=329885 RepID=A0AAN6H2B3_9PEZI|nr:Glutathione S-transferase 2 [Friedmanniomyces endolithicus]KAK0845207.1 Glutathione S-transferase 2 [Friedmanniomyces endolithicus]KAK0914287.1 Glutathione S-transferase 2 [Friedmanniomyces endolithicus]KAK0953590.1 Glutathione S-transferase 2 [Friedmanniomyces endolithicus]KAK1022981.1 Glutathione S-transferase 2 [Friedmanniomyces endolithicus]
MSSEKPDIHLYTTQTPNGIKISITLEELGCGTPQAQQAIGSTARLTTGLQHTIRLDQNRHLQEHAEGLVLGVEHTSKSRADIPTQEQWFLDINPNGRIPALTDKFTDGKLIRLFESGAIMQYLVERYDSEHKISFAKGSREHIEMTNWLFFMNAGVGPMQGQANHFTRYAPEHIEYGVNRYQNETRRLYGVLDKHLSDTKSDYLVGGKCTIADIAHWGWVSAAGWAGIQIEDFPALKAWEERMWERKAVQKGAGIPDPYKMKELLADKEKVGFVIIFLIL